MKQPNVSLKVFEDICLLVELHGISFPYFMQTNRRPKRTTRIQCMDKAWTKLAWYSWTKLQWKQNWGLYTLRKKSNSALSSNKVAQGLNEAGEQSTNGICQGPCVKGCWCLGRNEVQDQNGNARRVLQAWSMSSLFCGWTQVAGSAATFISSTYYTLLFSM